jgi:hypothetical protein
VVATLVTLIFIIQVLATTIIIIILHIVEDFTSLLADNGALVWSD